MQDSSTDALQEHAGRGEGLKTGAQFPRDSPLEDHTEPTSHHQTVTNQHFHPLHGSWSCAQPVTASNAPHLPARRKKHTGAGPSAVCRPSACPESHPDRSLISRLVAASLPSNRDGIGAPKISANQRGGPSPKHNQKPCCLAACSRGPILGVVPVPAGRLILLHARFNNLRY